MSLTLERSKRKTTASASCRAVHIHAVTSVYGAAEASGPSDHDGEDSSEDEGRIRSDIGEETGQQVREGSDEEADSSEEEEEEEEEGEFYTDDRDFDIGSNFTSTATNWVSRHSYILAARLTTRPKVTPEKRQAKIIVNFWGHIANDVLDEELIPKMRNEEGQYEQVEFESWTKGLQEWVAELASYVDVAEAQELLREAIKKRPRRATKPLPGINAEDAELAVTLAEEAGKEPRFMPEPVRSWNMHQPQRHGW